MTKSTRRCASVRAPLLAMAACALLSACALAARPAPAQAVTPDVSGLIRGGAVAATVAPGGTATLSLTLLDQALPLDLAAYIQYADGATQTVEETADQVDVTLRWTVPTSAPLGAGVARVVATRSCMCGSIPPHQGATHADFRVVARSFGWWW